LKKRLGVDEPTEDAAPADPQPADDDLPPIRFPEPEPDEESTSSAECQPPAAPAILPLTRENIDAYLAETGQTRIPDASPDPQIALKMRAKRLGHRMNRRGKQYRLTDLSDDGGSMVSESIDALNRQLDIIEFNLPIQYSTACGWPMHRINVPEGVA
jgi:hypothetical protein